MRSLLSLLLALFLPVASFAQIKAYVRYATDAEALAATSALRALTPANLAALGLDDAPTEKATGAEVITGTDDAKFVTAKAIKDAAIYPNPLTEQLQTGAYSNATTTYTVWTGVTLTPGAGTYLVHCGGQAYMTGGAGKVAVFAIRANGVVDVGSDHQFAHGGGYDSLDVWGTVTVAAAQAIDCVGKVEVDETLTVSKGVIHLLKVAP